MANPIKSLKNSLGQIPTKYRYWTSLAILAALLIALPVTLIGLMTGTFELRKRAVTSEVTPIPSPIILPPCNQEYLMTRYDDQGNITRQDPYTLSNDTCGGLRCLLGLNEMTPSCYDINKCNSVCSGKCVNIRQWQTACGLIPTSSVMGCGQSCGPDAACAPGLICGTPCPPGQACAQYMRCYNPSCPYDLDCICIATPSATPTVIPCGQEGETIPVYPGYECCPGLEAISPNKPDGNGNCPGYPLLGASVCVKDCGDGQCSLGENKCNCPEDCGPGPTVSPSSITLKIRFKGVTSRPIDDSSKNLKIYATNLTGGPDLGSADYRLETLFYVDDTGIYSKEIGLEGSYIGHRYRLRIKGPKHLQSVFPDVYFQAGGELDLTYSPLRPGDLDQDGDVDINDIRKIDERIFSKDPADIVLADVNFDGKVDIFDRALVFQTLSVQYDPD